MRSTSSARKAVSVLLCVILSWPAGGAAAQSGGDREPCLLLKMSSDAVSDGSAKELLAPLPDLLLRELGVRWVPLPSPPLTAGAGPPFPDADDASLGRISGLVAEAARRVNAMETAEADGKLREAENEARRFRIGEPVRPFLAEIFLLRGLMRLWTGDRAGAEESLARMGALRPDFHPDPALFSPSFREVWARASRRPPPGAELMVRSLPPGAGIFLNGVEAGTTPGRVRPPVAAPVRVSVRMPGYLPEEKVGQWLPGDSEIIEVTLARDRAARLGELASAPNPGSEAGAILSEMAEAAGAGRVAIILMDAAGGKRRARVVSMTRGDAVPAVAGTLEWPAGDDAAERAASDVAALLKSAGWPAVSEGTRTVSSWYHKWWFWAVLGGVVAGVAAAVGGSGGGGGSGDSTGAIGVNF